MITQKCGLANPISDSVQDDSMKCEYILVSKRVESETTLSNVTPTAFTFSKAFVEGKLSGHPTLFRGRAVSLF
jgi:hypothetical protein